MNLLDEYIVFIIKLGALIAMITLVLINIGALIGICGIAYKILLRLTCI